MSRAVRTFESAIDEHMPARARKVVRNALIAWEYSDEIVDAATLLVSELVTNVLRHTSATTCAVRFEVAFDLFTLEVFDQDPRLPRSRPASQDAESGRGLDIVESVAAGMGGTCGVREYPNGKSVYFTLKVPPLPSNVVARERAALGEGW